MRESSQTALRCQAKWIEIKAENTKSNGAFSLAFAPRSRLKIRFLLFLFLVRSFANSAACSLSTRNLQQIRCARDRSKVKSVARAAFNLVRRLVLLHLPAARGCRRRLLSASVSLGSCAYTSCASSFSSSLFLTQASFVSAAKSTQLSASLF